MKVAYFFLFFVLLAGQAVGFSGAQHDYSQVKGLSDLPGMAIEGAKYMLGVQEVDRVRGSAYLNDVRKKMAEYGLKKTHHIMAGFEDVVSNDATNSGSVALTVEDPDENISETIKLLEMEGNFGADISLDKKGMYHFKISTKLADGKTRVFYYRYDNK